MPESAESRFLHEETCRLICPVSAGLLGVCLTGVGLMRVVITVSRRETLADDILSIDASLFLVAMVTSYFALRIRHAGRLHWLERAADITFLAGAALLTVVCFVITYDLNFG